MRYALYFAPAADHPLWALGNAWLGRDPATGNALPQPAVPGLSAAEIAAHTAAPRRYGLHATIKPPFHLAAGCDEAQLLADAAAFAARQTPFALPPLTVDVIDDFIALRTSSRSAPLHALADACVAGFDAFRAPPDAAELARRGVDTLDAAAAARLARWGYPHVFEGFEFHVSLTQGVDRDVQSRLLPWLHEHFAPALTTPCAFDSLAVYVEPAPAAPLRLAQRYSFAGWTPR